MDEAGADQTYCVLRLTDERVDISAVARLAAGALGRPRFEMARELRTSHGIIARDAPEAAARQIVEGLRALGIDARMVPEADVVPLPAAERVRQIVTGHKGLYFRLAGEDLVVPWESLVVVLAARLGGDVTHVFRASEDMVAGPYGARRNIAHAFDWSSTRHVSHLVIDFFPDNPWRRLRVEEGLVDFRLDRDPDRPSTTNRFEELGCQVRDWGRSAYLNPGAAVLGEHGKALVWQDLTFENARFLDFYSLWQVQVAVLQGDG